MIQLKRILAATDFSDCSRHAMRYACEFAATFGAELHLVFVNEPPAAAFSEFGIGYVGVKEVEDEIRRGAVAKIETLPGQEWEGKFSISRAVLFGTPFVEVVRYAREKEIDLVVLGTHGRGSIVHMLMGSTAEKIVRKAPCPVLTVRPEGHEFVLP